MRREALSSDSEEFLSYLAVERGRAATSIASYRRDLCSYEIFLREKDLEVRAVTPPVIEEYLGVLGAKGLAPSSRARALVAIRGLHGFCLDERGATSDPTEDISGPRVPQGVPKALSEAQMNALLESPVGDSARARRDRAILELLYATGIRISELAGMAVADVDFDLGLVRVIGKGSKERLVPVGAKALEAARLWLLPEGRSQLSHGTFARRDDAEALFTSSRGRRLSRGGIWDIVHHHATRVGLEAIVTPHVLRHTFATHLLDHGADIRVVQELLGHASVTTTQIYTKVSQEHLRREYFSAHPRARIHRESPR